MSRPLGQFHAFVNRRMQRNPVHVQQLKCTEPQRDQNFDVNLGVRMFKENPDALIEIDLPAQNAEHQSGGQMTICFGES